MSETKSVEELLKDKYSEVKKEISEIVDISLFQEIDEEDLLNMIELVFFLFPDDKTLFNLNELITLQGTNINDEQKDKIVVIIDKYIIWLRKLRDAIEKV